MLEDTGDLAAAVTAILAGASAAGLDPGALVSLHAAIRALDPAGAPPSCQASHRGSGYGSDSEFLEAISEAEDQIRDRIQAATQLQEQATTAAGQAQADLDDAQQDLRAAKAGLAAAHAMPTRHPCTGCHGAKTAAIAAAEDAIAAAAQRITEATRRLRLCEDVTEIPGPLAQRLDRGRPRQGGQRRCAMQVEREITVEVDAQPLGRDVAGSDVRPVGLSAPFFQPPGGAAQTKSKSAAEDSSTGRPSVPTPSRSISS